MEREAGIRQQPIASCNTLRAHGVLIATHTHTAAPKKHHGLPITSARRTSAPEYVMNTSCCAAQHITNPPGACSHTHAAAPNKIPLFRNITDHCSAISSITALQYHRSLPCNITLRAHGGLIATHTHRRAKKASRPSNHIGAPHKRP